MTIDNKYLQVLDVLFGREHDYEINANSQWEDAPNEEEYRDLRLLISGKGIEIGEFGEPGDGIWCVWEDGKLKLTAYISTRGALYQVGAYDGEKAYGATNLDQMHNGQEWIDVDMKEWIEVSNNWIPASIAMRGWDWAKEWDA